MTTMTQGTVTILLPELVQVPEQAGALHRKEVQRLPKPGDIIPICRETAEAMARYPESLATIGVSPEALLAEGAVLEALDVAITDLERMTKRLKQARVLVAARAYGWLRRVVAQVRVQQKFYAGVTGLVPRLVGFFSRPKKAGPAKPQG
jgi:hypothetical protein